MSASLSRTAERVQRALEEAGVALQVVEFPASTRTAVEAAAAIGCEVAQIAKSLIFRGVTSGQPVLVIASGSNRVNEERLSAIAGEPLAKASADFVREHTGFAIGGVPPIGHLATIRTYIDRDLLSLTTLWGAAGTPNAVFSMTPAELLRITRGEVIDVAADR